MAAVHKRALLVAVAVTCVVLAAAHCPNMCSGHGDCFPVSKCTCYSRWQGGDCSMKRCPFGEAWTDLASADDTAHARAECSNQGTCDTETGLCKCHEGFEGLACQRMSCVNDCSSHGTCVNMRDHARTRSQGDALTVLTYSNNWDATKIYGCECDAGYAGYDCSLRNCPSGDDPLTTDQDDERQYFKCLEDPTDLTGYFTLTFRGFTTEPIYYNDEAETVQTRLNALPTVKMATVRYEGSITTACSGSGDPNPIQVTFLRELGDLPHLLSIDPSTHTHPPPNFVFAYDGEEMDGQLSVKGTKEDLFCSGRGRCDTQTGICHCYTGYFTSNGRGEEGVRGDCGYANEAITSCPGFIECSGHGVCSDHPYYQCSCDDGWMGGDCSERICPMGNAWFDYPFDPVLPRSTNDRAHDLAECSNKGTCNRATGECVCQKWFEGGACERISCAQVLGNTCNGHGKCLNMYQLALLTQDNGDATDITYGAIPNDPATWDFNKMYGCYCDEGFQGYDCSERVCPTGDDITTTGQNKEVQVFHCLSSDGTGTFRLKFRQGLTATISATASAADLEEALENLDQVGSVGIQFESGDQVCTTTPGNTVRVEFITELADLPAMTVEDGSAELTFTWSLDGDNSLYYQSLQGTMENSECSERGLCNHATGLCECFVGFGSSDSSGGAGGRGDCGHREPFTPVIPNFSKKLADLELEEAFDTFT